VREVLDAAGVRQWGAAGLAALRRHEREINQLNVYPVPDGDTGTNLLRTFSAAHRALTAPTEEGGAPSSELVGDVLRVMARGALLGARGNSGVIFAQWLRGLADPLAGAAAVEGAELADALAGAAKASYTAVAEPVEGTILSVAGAAARAAGLATDRDLATVIRAAAEGAAEALARTPGQLPVLAAAGVVDAGGRGLVVLLDTLVEVVTGERPPRQLPVVVPTSASGEPRPSAADRYEVQYLLDATEPAVQQLRRTLAASGDSLVIADAGEGTWQVHVHVADAGAAVEAGLAAGRPRQISITRLVEVRPGETPHLAEGPRPHAGRAAVVVANGDGLVELFQREGAVVVGSPPSTEEMLAAIRATGAGEVVVLPNDPDAQAVATTAATEADREGIRVSVVPTRSPVQALAALAVREASRRFDDDVIAMAEAAGACRYAQVCRAARDALTVAGRCRAGDVLALVEDEVHLIGTDVTEVSIQLLDRLLGGGGELVSVVLGVDAPAGLAAALTDHLAEAWPFVEVQVHHGGQPHYPLLVGVE